VDDPTAGDVAPRTGPVQGSTPQDDPGARAKADVRAILGKALGLRRLVELAAEFGGAAEFPRPELPRPRYRRPGHRPAG
jgi:hypothetical protein